MDTGSLSEEAYRAIMIEAERFNHDLTLQFGLLSGECSDENDFVEKSLLLIGELKTYDEMDIDYIFFGNPPKTVDFHRALKKIEENIQELKKIPLERRSFDF
jgi:hypothetical protein